MGKIITTLTLEKRNSKGKILESFTKPSRSWTKHFFDLLYEPLGFMTNTQAAVNDITPAARALTKAVSATVTLDNLQIGTPPGNVAMPLIGWNGANITAHGVTQDVYYTGDQLGIVIGTGAVAVTPTDDKLGTKIAHGEAATQLLYGGTELYGLTYANPNVSFNIRRYFTNVAGGAINVTESGLYSPGYSANPISYLFCICRDVFGAVAINNGQILSVVYTVQTTV